MVYSLARQVALEVVEGGGDDALDLAALCAGAAGREAEATDVAANADAGGQHVLALGVDGALELGKVHVGDVAVGGLVAAVVVLDDEVKDGGKDGVGLLIAGVQADARVLVVHARLDGTIQGEAV